MSRHVTQVLLTIAIEGFSPERPFAVVVHFSDGRKSQETLCKTLLDARIYGNGVCQGLYIAGMINAPINPVLDERFLLTSEETF